MIGRAGATCQSIGSSHLDYSGLRLWIACPVVGSYSHGLLAITFAPSTPDRVLSAFSALAVPGPSAAPALPSPAVEPWFGWEPDWRVRGGERDPYDNEPWLHDWASELSGVLRWSSGKWELLCRFFWKTYPQAASEALAWLAPFVATEWRPRRQLVGHVHHEYDPAPHLFWVENGQWERQDMNPEGYIAP